MFKWSAFPFIRVSLSLAGGILLYDAFPALWSGYVDLIPIGLLLLIAFWFVRSYRLVYGSFLLLFLIYLGGALALLHNDSLEQNHYTHFPNPNGFVGTIISDNTEKENYQRYELKLQLVQKDSVITPVTGKIFLYVRKAEASALLRYGDVVTVSENYFPVSSPKNPQEFDYQQYLAKQDIFAHAFVEAKEVAVVDHLPPNQLRAFAYHIRSSALSQLDVFVTYERERAILAALLLGVKDHLDNELKTAYASAGAMHVLAVSGLHVGIIYMALAFLLKGIKETRWGKLPFVMISISIIWLYALVTGFSPSVMRAATMFSVIIISEGFNRKANVYNSLGIAACILIVYDPYLIYSVGFQLSFAAVFGIVKLFPVFYHKLEISNKIGNYCWQITCVSIAAQIATFPLTVHYFHQFPTYSLISNLLVIPAAFVMLGVGIIMLIVGSLFTEAGVFIGTYFEELVWAVNEGISFVEILPYPIVDWLYLDTYETILIYLFIIFATIGLARYSFPNMALAGLTVIVLFTYIHWLTFNRDQQQKIVFYNIDGATAIDLVDGSHATLLVDSISKEAIDYQVNPHRLASGLPEASSTLQSMSESPLVYRHSVLDLIDWKGKRILCLKDAAGFEFTQPITVDVIYIPKPQRIDFANLKAKQVILGNQFNVYDRQRLLDALENKVKVHSLLEDGFWELDLNGT